MERSDHPLLYKQSLTNLAEKNAVLLSDVIVSLPCESTPPPVLWGPLLSARLQRMVSEITLNQSNSPHYLPHPKTAQTLTHALTTFKGQPKLQLVIHEYCCNKTAQAVCIFILKKVSGTLD